LLPFILFRPVNFYIVGYTFYILERICPSLYFIIVSNIKRLNLTEYQLPVYEVYFTERLQNQAGKVTGESKNYEGNGLRRAKLRHRHGAGQALG
jgi:hypothetical protein